MDLVWLRPSVAGQPMLLISIVTPLSFLSGKVLKWSLPVLELPLAPDAPPLKRLALDQGELAQVYDAEEGLRYLAVIELRAGSIRGNHYHHQKQELIYVIRGALRLTVKDLASGPHAAFAMARGDLAFIPTQVAHALEVLKSGEAVEFSPTRFDPSDSQPFVLIKPELSAKPGVR